ncbi:MAG: MATE family efflux transporter, partial [Thermoplasmata archaeon]|nr:MATE family efflux transporter [Thermoplasmata archaeon]
MKVPEKEILGGDIVKVIFVLGWPTMVLQILQVAYNMADTFWLGRWSTGTEAKSAVAAMQISWPLIFVMISIGAGFGVAGISLVSQYTGAGKSEKASHATGQLITMALILATILSISGLLITPYLLKMMSLESSVESYSLSYMEIIFLGLPFVFLSFMFMSVFRAFGSPLIPMYVNGFGVLLNIVLDPILINGYYGAPSLGVVGAALATILSRSVATVISLYIVHRGVAGLKVHLKHLLPVKFYVKKILRIGAPAALGQFSSALGFFALMAIIASLPNSTVAIAAYGVGDRIIEVGFIIIMGLGMGMATVVGHSLGAKNFSRAKEAFHTTLKISFVILALMTMVIALFREDLVAFFI